MKKKKPNIDDLYDLMFETIHQLKEDEIEVAQAKTIRDIGQVIVNAAKVECDFMNKIGGLGSGFIPMQNTERPLGLNE